MKRGCIFILENNHVTDQANYDEIKKFRYFWTTTMFSDTFSGKEKTLYKTCIAKVNKYYFLSTISGCWTGDSETNLIFHNPYPSFILLSTPPAAFKRFLKIKSFHLYRFLLSLRQHLLQFTSLFGPAQLSVRLQSGRPSQNKEGKPSCSWWKDQQDLNRFCTHFSRVTFVKTSYNWQLKRSYFSGWFLTTNISRFCSRSSFSLKSFIYCPTF